MFSEELENLIQATLEDGVLEDNEKAALVKRAQREGVDLDELEIYINSLIQKRHRELNERKDAQYENYKKEKKEAFGRKCPNCGKQVSPLTLKCDCGYEFTSGKKNSTMEALQKKFLEIESWDKGLFEVRSKFVERQVRAKADAIKMIPIPNTKEDIIEFLSLSLPNSRKEGGLWGTKMGRVIVMTLISLLVSIAIAIAMSIYGSSMDSIFLTFLWIMIVVPGYTGLIVMGGTDPIFEHNDLVNTWRMKFQQVMLKARSMRGDPDFQRELDYFEQQFKSK